MTHTIDISDIAMLKMKVSQQYQDYDNLQMDYDKLKDDQNSLKPNQTKRSIGHKDLHDHNAH